MHTMFKFHVDMHCAVRMSSHSSNCGTTRWFDCQCVMIVSLVLRLKTTLALLIKMFHLLL